MQRGVTINAVARDEARGMRRDLLVAFAVFFAIATASPADTVRSAPTFTFTSADGVKTPASLRGQPIVLIIARSAKTKALRVQLKNLNSVYHDLSSRGTIFVAAITEGDAAVASNIPFAIASNGPGVAAAYGMRGDFLIAVIGRDGNVDVQTDKVLPGKRVLEVLKNNFDVQEKSRRELPKGPPGQ